MANPEHLEILKSGVKVWNEWREENVEITPELNRADLSDTVLAEANLSGANLFSAVFRETILRLADLSSANLRVADFYGADLRSVNLRGADLTRAFLSQADFFEADFSHAILYLANFGGSDLRFTNFSNAKLKWTIFADNNLSTITGLETIIHVKPSTIGTDTVYKSRGKIPEVFLRGCGLPDSFITQIPALVAALEPLQFYSCFISYSSKDQSFAERLNADLQRKGVRCWFAPEDLKIGAEIRTGIDESIRVHDKLLLVLSETSVKSQWVQQEVETALAREREQGRTVLFPIRVDDGVRQINTGWPAYLKNTRNIGDFTRWKEHDSYRKAFERLLRDLKAEERNPDR